MSLTRCCYYRELCCSAFAKKTAEDLAEQYGGETVECFG